MIELTGITWEHERGFAPMAATALAYERMNPNVRIHWEKRSLQAFADFPLSELAPRFDLLVVDHPHMGDVARGKYLLAMDTVGRDGELKTLAAQSVGASFESYRFGKHLWALPIDAATQVASYREDLLDRVPRRWEEVIELAKRGSVIWPIKPVDSMMSFLTLAANRGIPCRVDGAGSLMDRQRAATVLEMLRELATLVPAECLAMNPIQAYERMCAEDRFAYCPLGYGYSNYARPGYRKRTLRFTNIAASGEIGPGGTTLGGTGLAVSATSQHREIALDYAFWVVGSECQKTVYFDAGGQPGNAAAWEDDRVNRESNDFFRGTRDTLERAHVRPRYDGFLYLQDKGGDAVNACLSGKMTIDATLDLLEEIDQNSRLENSFGGRLARD